MSSKIWGGRGKIHVADLAIYCLSNLLDPSRVVRTDIPYRSSPYCVKRINESRVIEFSVGKPDNKLSFRVGHVSAFIWSSNIENNISPTSQTKNANLTIYCLSNLLDPSRVVRTDLLYRKFALLC